jgi:hypothetical protein
MACDDRRVDRSMARGGIEIKIGIAVGVDAS